jgi:glycosyltransferase involved in cell wall biosynthesis
MRKTPFYSVIIPFYNASMVISNSITSIINQEFNNFEVIFVDDGSVDDSVEIINSYNFKDPVKIISQKNKGQGAARNNGILCSTGEYIAFLDADDIWYPNKLLDMYEFINNYGGDVISHDEKIIKNDSVIGIHKCGPYSSYEDLLFKRNCLSPSATIVKKSVLIDIGLFDESEELRGVEDFDLWLRIAKKKYKFNFYNIVLGEYIYHNSNEVLKSGFPLKELNVFRKHFNSLTNSQKVKFGKQINYKKKILYFTRGYGLMKKGYVFSSIKYVILSMYYKILS